MSLPRDAEGRQLLPNGVAFRIDNCDIEARPDETVLAFRDDRLVLVDFDGYVIIPKERIRRVNGMRVLLDPEADA